MRSGQLLLWWPVPELKWSWYAWWQFLKFLVETWRSCCEMRLCSRSFVFYEEISECYKYVYQKEGSHLLVKSFFG